MKAAWNVPPLLAVLLAGTSACSASSPTRAPWIDGLIAGFESKPVANPPHRIVQYRYHDKTVYYVPPSCCDRPSTLYDESGGVVCSPDGGLTGRGDGRCTDFAAKRSDEVLIWADPRGQ
ncbi:DUF6970 domain-containing protein [Dokdonella immobilis]|uniref:DUF6970 domain-containing protein n=1 Tax=Dokdonella immobilis TaxID=578942 RepID=A0A1I4Y7C9_9GAMM|nr:hypothetical protein [Dokdonella immobilis]SFN33992.1 hypothetical protein SAMN05216289_11568 [Dokdonella immobilis]